MEKHEAIFAFLQKNRMYNKDVQTNFYKGILSPFEDKEDKIIALLHHVANTQSKPNMDKLSVFFQLIHTNRSKLNSYASFLEIFKCVSGGSSSYLLLFEKLCNEDGWGNKTAALFCKMVFHLHSGEYNPEFKIWDDAPNIDDNDTFYLPVDAVIIEIFSRIELGNNFKKINTFLNKHYKGKDIEVWDDLWFWGFISQKSNGATRALAWNEAKYWSQLETNKDETVIKEIKDKVSEFINHIKNEKAT
jgi:hypothetical protein